jgi:hypothetical protein
MDLGAWIRTDDYYFHRHYAAVITTIVMTVGIACALAALAACVVRATHEGTQGPVRLASLLSSHREDQNQQPGNARTVLVRNTSGTLYQGSFFALDADREAATSSLVLGGPIVFRHADGTAKSMPSEWDRLALRLRDVAEIWVRSSRVTTPGNQPGAASEPMPSTAPDGDLAWRSDGDQAGVVSALAPSAPPLDETRRRHFRRTRASATPGASSDATR